VYETCPGRINPANRIAYAIYGYEIVFTGLTDGKNEPRGSTINCAEQIILAISQAEKINPREYQFFDLQTHRGYCSHKVGDFSFNKLGLEWQPDVNIPVWVGWEEGDCRAEILGEWLPYIWGDHPQGKTRNLARYRQGIG
jgi:hypothetical protein